jgi:hypothetical protein
LGICGLREGKLGAATFETAGSTKVVDEQGNEAYSHD